jgi:hypothetical protein
VPVAEVVVAEIGHVGCRAKMEKPAAPLNVMADDLM